MRPGYDLRHVSLAQTGLLTFALKRDALSLAKARGWRAHDVTRGYNRFCIFWFVAQDQGEGLVALTANGTTTLPHPPERHPHPPSP